MFWISFAWILERRLPVAASAAASTAASATAATTTAVSTAVAASATAAKSAAASTAASAAASATTAFTLRAGFVHYDLAAFEIFSVESCNGFIGFAIITDFHETESARLARKTIADQCDGIGLDPRFAE